MKATLYSMLLIGLSLAGCSGSEAKTPTEPPATAPSTQAAAKPDLPQDLEDDLKAGATEIIVKVDPNAVRREPSYVRNAEMPRGKLSGVCRFADAKANRVPPDEPADLKSGPYAVKEPVKGEVEYYENIKIVKPRYYAGYPRLHPTHVVLMFRGVKAGKRGPLLPTGFMNIHGYCRGLSGNHNANTCIQFAPIDTRQTFFTYEAFPNTFILSRADTGKELFRGKVAYQDTGAANATEVGGGHKIWIASKPEPIQGPILHEGGLYRIDSERHPWQFGWLWLVDNPYVDVVAGDFEIDDLPVGKHRVDVWHPEYEVVTKSFEIEIRKDETSEVAIELKAPPELAAPPAAK